MEKTALRGSYWVRLRSALTAMVLSVFAASRAVVTRSFWVRARTALVAAVLAAFRAARNRFFNARRKWRKPGFKSSLFKSIAWIIFVGLYGLIVGATVVILPPMVPISLIALTAPFLFWTLPEMPNVPTKSLRIFFFATVITFICVPDYYMVQVSGLPWISLRRVFVFLLIATTLYTMATSKIERRFIANTLAVAPGLRLCIFGFLLMSVTSLIFSESPTASLTQLFDMILNWYLPLFATVLVIRSEVQAEGLFRAIAYFSLVVAAIGIISFVRESNLALDLIPRALLANMMAANKTIADLVTATPFRNGFYRASSIFHVGLSFGEFGVMVAPIAAYFILHARRIGDRILGFVVMIAVLLIFFVSGSRGGSIGFVLTMPLLLAMFVYRYSRLHPRSMVGPLAATFSSIGVVAFLALIFLSTRLHNIVFGGYDAGASNDARIEQTQLAMEQVAKNPIFGHGIGLGGDVINWIGPGGVGSVDSYFLSVIVETGVPGAIFYFGMIFVAAAILIKIYLTDMERGGAIAGPLACSLLSYGFYRFFLSQKENQTLFFIFLGLTFVFARASASRLAARQPKRANMHRPGARARALAGTAPAEPERLPVS